MFNHIFLKFLCGNFVVCNYLKEVFNFNIFQFIKFSGNCFIFFTLVFLVFVSRNFRFFIFVKYITSVVGYWVVVLVLGGTHEHVLIHGIVIWVLIMGILVLKCNLVTCLKVGYLYVIVFYVRHVIFHFLI